MTSIGSPSPFFLAGKKAYEIERSLRFNSSDSAYLSRTPSSAGNRKKWTWSAWIKRTNLGRKMLFGTPDSNDPITNIEITSSNGLAFYNYDSGYTWDVRPSRVFRDVGAWFHLVVVADTGNSTSGDRIQIYFNGVRETSFGTETYPSQNYEGGMNKTIEHRIGSQGNRSGQYFDGYMTEINFVDGQAYDASYFGQTDSVTGQWIPKRYGGSYGTNGFYLNFSTNTLGTDRSGNGNDFTPNNFSVVAGAGNDAIADTPTNNFCTLNELNKTNNCTLKEGALTLYTDSNDQAATGTFAVKSGKWYWEVDMTAAEPEVGIAHHNMPLSNKGTSLPSDGQISFIVQGADGNSNFLRVDGNTQSGTGITAQSGPGTIGIALDADNKKIWFTNTSGSYFNSGNPATGANPAVDFSSTGPNYPTGVLTPFVSMYQGSAKTVSINFGQYAFSYTAPTGFKTLCSANLPDPTILLPNKHFDTFLYNATGNAMSFPNELNFQPDWIWQKSRNSTGSSNVNYVIDAVRGGDKGLVINSTNAEYSGAAITFTSNGYDMGASSGGQGNGSGNSYVSWNWDAGETDGKTYTVTVVSDSGNKYRFDGFGTSAVTLDLAEGGTYIFNYPSAHPFRFSATSDGTHGGGTEYTTGVTVISSTSIQIVVAASAPTLYYYCSSHSGMGGAINTNSTLGSSNFDGSTQSTVKVNQTAGFSIVRYTGNGSTATIGHGLGAAPQIYIVKETNSTSDWYVYHKEAGADRQLKWNTNDGDTDNDRWQDTHPTSSVFYLAQKTASNGSGDTYITYCFSEVAGYSKIGKYTGNGNSNGPFVFTGFKPAFIMIKRTAQSAASGWFILDNKRNTFNVVNNKLNANQSAEENEASTIGANGANDLDFLSNGFKLRASNTGTNKSGNGYVYMAFAESPFKNARAR